jgi:quercetin dioxygenase-like cupin family protein
LHAQESKDLICIWPSNPGKSWWFMKAARVLQFGPPDVITNDDAPQPKAGAGQLLVRVKAAATFKQVLVAAAVLAAGGASAAGGDAGETVKPVATQDLPNLPGKRLTAIVVTYAPGAKSARHHHAGSVWAYVLSGAIRSQNSATGPAKVYRAGDSFFEPPGSEHLVSENASATESASLLAVHIADDVAGLTTLDK